MDRRTGPLIPGDRFLKYEIRRLIGRGGHAYVYEAHDDFLNLPVAVKVIPSSADTGKDLAGRARAEARVLVRLAHDNVVKVMDAGATDDGLVYLIMELLRGRDLRKTLQQYRRLTVAEALGAAQQIAAGVTAAHHLGAIHRDLKPENVFIEPGNKFKVLDFGVAKVMGYGAPTTQRDMLHGTMLYMSPEQLHGAAATAQSDIFALGTMLYEALHAHPVLLFGQPKGLEELGKIIIGAVPQLLSDRDPTIPSYVSRLVQRAIAKKPEQRFGDMDELRQAAAEALQRYVAEGNSAELRDLTSDPPAPQSDTEPVRAPLLSGTATAPIQPMQPVQAMQPMQPVQLHTEPLRADQLPVAETRTRPLVLGAQETPPPITSTGPVRARFSAGRHKKLFLIAGSLAFGLGLGTAYETLKPGEVAEPTAPPRAARAPAVAPPPVEPPAPAAEPPAAAAEPPAAAVEPPAAAVEPTTPVTTPAESVVEPPLRPIAKPEPAPEPATSVKPNRPSPTAKPRENKLDVSKLPSSGLDD
jgi:eukaryotic-like serine/threonine-protein kinase